VNGWLYYLLAAAVVLPGITDYRNVRDRDRARQAQGADR
jgi:hypothetical protein